ncbi:MAG: O-antigen ligase family protein, partial [Actinomycetota bacterium]|nr:O-antigen ligase family protein [Actinomycetota bacterium]
MRLPAAAELFDGMISGVSTMPRAFEVQARTLAFTAAGAGVVGTAVGVATHDRVLAAGSAGVGVLSLSALAPEFLIALLMLVGGIKDASWLRSLPIDASLLTAAGVLVAMGARALRRGVRPLPPAAVLPVLLAALIAASLLWAPLGAGGANQVARFEGLTLLAFFAGAIMIRDRADFTRLMVGLTGVALVVVALAQRTSHANQPLVVVGGGSGGEIELAYDCAVGLVAGAYVVARARGPLRLLPLGAALVLAYTLVSAGSRGVLVGAIVAAGYALVVTRRSWMRPRPIALALAAAAALVVAGPALGQQAIVRYQTQLFSGNTSAVLGQRSYIFHRGEQLALEHPLGLGAGGFPARTGLVYPHNIELQLADEYGLTAVALFVALVAFAWSYRRRAWRLGWRAESVTIGALLL